MLKRGILNDWIAFISWPKRSLLDPLLIIDIRCNQKLFNTILASLVYKWFGLLFGKIQFLNEC